MLNNNYNTCKTEEVIMASEVPNVQFSLINISRKVETKKCPCMIVLSSALEKGYSNLMVTQTKETSMFREGHLLECLCPFGV